MCQENTSVHPEVHTVIPRQVLAVVMGPCWILAGSVLWSPVLYVVYNGDIRIPNEVRYLRTIGFT